ncbi:MAG: sigma-70 family RNA polymerase sigma factor [Opitutaceae bacterium]|jgi:RNA polymerase sigma factor (sigma-70 family)
MIDDVTLLRRFSHESSQEAFEELVRRHIGLVYNAALRRLGNDSHLAEDVTQTVFSGLAQKAASVRIRSSLTGWLYCRARSAAIDVIRSEQQRRSREQQAQVISGLSALRPTTSDWGHLRPEIEEAIEELNESDRDVVLLRFFERQSFSEIGALLKISEDAAQKRAERALDKMRAGFSKRGLTSTTAVLAGMLANQGIAAVPVGLSSSVSAAALTCATSVGALTTIQGVLIQMSTAKLGMGIASLVALFAVGSASYEGYAARQAQTSLATAQASLTAALATLKADLAKQQQLAGIAAEDDQKLAELQKTVDERRTSAALDLDELGLTTLQRFRVLADIQRYKGGFVKVIPLVGNGELGDAFIKLFGITPSERAAMESDIGAARQKILELEAKSASVTTDDQGRVVISIQENSGANIIYDGLVSRLMSTLGSDRSESFLPMVGDGLSMELDQAGHSNQTFTLTHNPPSAASPQGNYTMRTVSTVITGATVYDNMAEFAKDLGPIASLVPANF